jgi:hypothetical protein
MPHDAGTKRRKHLVLLVVIPLMQLLVRSDAVVPGPRVEGGVVVDGDAVDVVDAADEVVDGRVGGEGGDVGPVGGAEPFTFEADEDADAGGVLFAKALGFEEVGFMARGEEGEGGGGVVAELGMSVKVRAEGKREGVTSSG